METLVTIWPSNVLSLLPLYLLLSSALRILSLSLCVSVFFFVLRPWVLFFLCFRSQFFLPLFLFRFLPVLFFVSPPLVGYDSLSFYKAKIGGNGRPPKCPVTDPLSAFNAEI
jgi:hypothetical protein